MCYNHSFPTRTQEPYLLLLEKREWKAKRDRILTRDRYRCQRCGKGDSIDASLQVHHKHYILGLDPWEYKDSELITLCEECHHQIHITEEVPTLRLNNGVLEKLKLTPCSRCDGSGYLPQYRYVQNGICFRCHGQRYDEYIEECEKYANEHDINLSELEDGFSSFDDSFYENTSSIRVQQSQFDSNRLYLVIVSKDSSYQYAYLDFSVKAKAGDYIDLRSSRYKRSINKRTGRQMLIVKGHVVSSI